VTGFRRRLAPAVARRLIGDAGPPRDWVVSAFVVAAVIGVMLWTIGVPTILVGLVVVAIVTVPAALDVTGWRIRYGMAWLALEQRRRQPDIPRTVRAADRWVAEHPDAPAAVRASALITAGRHDEARALIEADEPTDAVGRARQARMLAAIDGLRDGHVDSATARAAIAELPPDERRFQSLALDWSIAWVDALNHRPWRQSFAAASRGIPIRQIPARWRLAVAVYELLATVLVAVFVVIALLAGWR